MFNIYRKEDLTEPVEMGLSFGELRQALLDRAREDLRQDKISFVLQFVRDSGRKCVTRHRLLNHFESILYNSNQKQLTREFDFVTDPVVVKEED